MIIARANENLARILPSNKQYIDLLKEVEILSNENPEMMISWGHPLNHIYAYRDKVIKMNLEV